MNTTGKSQLHTPFVPNQNGEVYTLESIHRPYQTVNSIMDTEMYYEYSLPKSFLIVDNMSEQVDNPFNTPAQFSLRYVQIADSSATLQIMVDNPDTNVVPNGVDAKNVPGIIMIGTVVQSMPSDWLDFQQFIMIKTNNVTNKMNFIIRFRRLRDQYIPKNVNMMNELTQ